MRAKCVYVYMCVSDGSVCLYVAGSAAHLHLQGSFLYHPGQDKRRIKREGGLCSFSFTNKINKNSSTLSPIPFRYYLHGILSFKRD